MLTDKILNFRQKINENIETALDDLYVKLQDLTEHPLEKIGKSHTYPTTDQWQNMESIITAIDDKIIQQNMLISLFLIMQ